MRLSDVVAHLGLEIFPIIGLACFGTVFAAVVWRIMRSDKATMQRAASMALGDDNESSAREGV